MEKSLLNNGGTLPEKDYFNKILIKLAIIIFALLIIFLVVAYLIQRNSQLTEQNPNEQNSNNPSKAMAATIPPEAAIIYQRSGTITEIQTDYLVMQSRFRTSSSDPLSAYVMRNVTVNVDGNTVYTKKSLASFKQTKTVPESQPSSKSELRVGDTINVRAAANIKNSTSFTAIAIEKIAP